MDGVSPVDITQQDPAGDMATELLRRYYDELDARFPGGFDLARTVEAPASELEAPRGAFLVARIDGSPIGCGALRKLDQRTSEIKRMWVDPRARGRRVGRELLTALENASVTLGCPVVRLDTSEYLTEALALYRSAGYEEIKAYNDNRYAAHWFEKSLAGLE